MNPNTPTEEQLVETLRLCSALVEHAKEILDEAAASHDRANRLFAFSCGCLFAAFAITVIF